MHPACPVPCRPSRAAPAPAAIPQEPAPAAEETRQPVHSGKGADDEDWWQE